MHKSRRTCFRFRLALEGLSLLFIFTVLCKNCNELSNRIINEMSVQLRITILLFFLLLVFSGKIIGQQSDFGIISGKRYLGFNDKGNSLVEKAQPIVQVPPTCGKKRRAAGNDLALPFGATAEFNYTKQFYYADNLMLTNDSNDIVAVGQASVQNSTSGGMKFLVRPDVWLLPILNVYGLFGYSQSSTNPNFTVPKITLQNVPIVGEIELDTAVTINEELVFYSPVYGVGATISAGFRFLFFILDYNYSVIKPGDLDDNLESHNFSGKLGVLVGNNEKKTKASIWFGVRYIADNHKFTGEINVKDILPDLEPVFGEKATYAGTVRAKQHWNLILGTSVMINKHHFLVMEAGYFDREQFTASYGYRF